MEKSNLLVLNHVDFDDACQPKGGFSASAKYTLRFNKGGFACCVDLSMLMVQIRSFWINISCLVHFYYMKHTGILFIQPNLLRDRKDNKFTVTDILLVATLWKVKFGGLVLSFVQIQASHSDLNIRFPRHYLLGLQRFWSRLTRICRSRCLGVCQGAVAKEMVHLLKSSCWKSACTPPNVTCPRVPWFGQQQRRQQALLFKC